MTTGRKHFWTRDGRWSIAFGLLVAALPAPSRLAAQPSDPPGRTNRVYACPLKSDARVREPDAFGSGAFDAIRRDGSKHGGLDLTASGGDPVFAIRTGRVSVAALNWHTNLGSAVILDHGDGEYSLYGHLDTVEVAAGNVVPIGGRLGTVGYSGSAAPLRDAGLPPVLHLGVVRIRNGTAVETIPPEQMRDWGNNWPIFSTGAVTPVNPESLLGTNCWTGSSTINSPADRAKRNSPAPPKGMGVGE